MAKKKKSKKKKQHDSEIPASSSVTQEQAEDGPPPKMKRKEYEREMRRLHGELVAMQEWVKSSGAKICVVFEGRDTAGKGGTIKRITERVSPRVFRVVALAAPTDREKSQMYVQRYIRHFPAAGEVVIFDRSWYNRAGVEPVMGFCTPEQSERFLEQVPAVEKAMVESGILLLKYWLEVGPDEQTRRLESRIDDPRKVWKLSDMDLKSYSRWYDYSRARDSMFAATDTAWGALVRRTHRRQEAGPAEHHQPPAEPGPVRAARASRRDAAQAAGGRRLRRAGAAVAIHPDAVLSRQPKTMPSPELDGAGSGSRIIRNEVTNPRSAARSGTSSATWSAKGRASVLIRMISAWTSAGCPTSSSSSWVLLITSASSSSAVCDLLLLGRREHGARLRHVRERDREGRQHDGSGEGQAEREPERAARRVHAGRLADPLIRDRATGCSC